MGRYRLGLGSDGNDNDGQGDDGTEARANKEWHKQSMVGSKGWGDNGAYGGVEQGRQWRRGWWLWRREGGWWGKGENKEQRMSLEGLKVKVQ
ncbi:hypothetical protein Syun_006080 [Stephania yunnanensis]|uniref:Uncharacterized protein n=1 Tax=Stephania yunnanensis TaxID=152371 RepID=A0AAP0KXK9_9MAGN